MKRITALVALLLVLTACAPAAAVVPTPSVLPAPPTVSPDGAPPAKAPPEGTIPPAPPADQKAGPAPTMASGMATPEPSDDIYAGWLTYTNDKYGFSLRYPEGWTLTEQPSDGRLSDAVQISRATFTLVLGFKGAGENLIIEAGMPAGGLAYRGKITMLGIEVPCQALAFEGKDKAVYYNGTSPVEAGELRMLASLNDFATSDYNAVAIPKEVQAIADQIVTSLELS